MKSSDHQSILYVSPADLKRSTFSSEFGEGNEESLQHSQLEQQLKEVFFYDFEDPIADFLDSISNIDVKIFLSVGDYLYHPLKPLLCMIWLSLWFGSRFSMMLVNHLLTWLHWKHVFT